MARESIPSSPLEDAVLILVSPIGILMGLFISPILLLAWPAGIVMLWISGAWGTGAKLFGTALSAVSFVWGAVIGLNFTWRNDDPGSVGLLFALALLLLLISLQMLPAIASVIYLWRNKNQRRAVEQPLAGNDHR
jgi:hypothetical protein